MITKQTFLDAADILEKEGKIQGHYVNPKTGCGVCCIGAIAEACNVKAIKQSGYYILDPTTYPDFIYQANRNHVMLDFIKQVVPSTEYPHTTDIFAWSDGHEQEEVIETMRNYGNSPDEQSAD